MTPLAAYPADIRNAVHGVGDAATHDYGVLTVIHIACPDLAALPANAPQQAVDLLAPCYRRVLAAFAHTDAQTLWCPPLSGGIYRGQQGQHLADITTLAWKAGFDSLAEADQIAVLNKESWVLCIYSEQQKQRFIDALSRRQDGDDRIHATVRSRMAIPPSQDAGSPTSVQPSTSAPQIGDSVQRTITGAMIDIDVRTWLAPLTRRTPGQADPLIGHGSPQVQGGPNGHEEQACAASAIWQLLSGANYSGIQHPDTPGMVAHMVRQCLRLDASDALPIADTWWAFMSRLALGPRPRLLILNAINGWITNAQCTVIATPGPWNGAYVAVLSHQSSRGGHFDPIWWPSSGTNRAVRPPNLPNPLAPIDGQWTRDHLSGYCGWSGLPSELSGPPPPPAATVRPLRKTAVTTTSGVGSET